MAGKTPSILDIGEQNWFGDVEPAEIHRLIETMRVEPAKTRLSMEYFRITAADRPEFLFDLARLFYGLIFDCERYRAIDLNGTALAERYDLNEPLPFDAQFSVVINLVPCPD